MDRWPVFMTICYQFVVLTRVLLFVILIISHKPFFSLFLLWPYVNFNFVILTRLIFLSVLIRFFWSGIVGRLIFLYKCVISFYLMMCIVLYLIYVYKIINRNINTWTLLILKLKYWIHADKFTLLKGACSSSQWFHPYSIIAK